MAITSRHVRGAAELAWDASAAAVSAAERTQREITRRTYAAVRFLPTAAGQARAVERVQAAIVGAAYATVLAGIDATGHTLVAVLDAWDRGAARGGPACRHRRAPRRRGAQQDRPPSVPRRPRT